MKKLLLLIPFLFSHFTYAVVCPAGEVDSGGVCVSACSILQGESRTYTYDSYIWGDKPTGFCFGSHSGGAACKMNATGIVSLNVPSGSQYWSREFTFSGSECDFGEINRFSGDTPEPFPYEGDVNQNGINDDFEDWDGDGINNGEDPDPYSNTSGVPDENKDGIPDDIEGVYEELTHTQEILYCNNDDDMCHQMRYAMRDLTNSNQILASAMRDASLKNVRRTDFNQSIGTLVSTVNSNDRAILSALEGIDISGADNGAEISELKTFLNNRISETTGINYQKIDGLEGKIQDVYGKTVLASNDSYYNRGKLNEISDAINALDSGGGSGLTSTQQTQLKNAAKASSNNKLLKQIQQRVDGYGQGFDMIYDGVLQNQRMISTVADDVNENTNAKFSDLSAQVAAISLDGVDVDLSSVELKLDGLSEKIDGIEGADLTGVESSISALGEKIDGIDGGSDASPSGSCSGGFVCSGNTYDCYLAQQSFETKCAIGNQRDLFGDVFEAALGSTNGQSYLDSANGELERSLNSLYEGVEKTAIAAGDGEQLYSEETDITEYLDTYNQDNGGLDFDNDQCPKPIELSFMLASVKQINMELSLEWLCELALYVRAMLMLGAAMISGRLWFQNY